MATWADFERADRAIATFGRERVDRYVSFLATVGADGSPRVHPVTPWVAVGRLLVRMYPTSPKATDPQRDPRYALHSMMDNDDGEGESSPFAARRRPLPILASWPRPST